jgi:hypothetical protein
MFTLADSFASLESQTTAWDEAEAPGTVTLNGTPYQCSVDVGSIKPDWDEKTMTTRMVQTATVRIRRSLLAECPSSAVRVVFRGLEWFIDGLGEQSDSARVWELRIKRIITKSAS